MNNEFNNFSQAHKEFLKRKKTKKIVILSMQIMILVVLLGIWEIFTRLGIIDSFIMSSPSRILKTIKILFQENSLLYHIGVTLYETLLGFILAVVIGVLVAIILWWNETLRKLLDPYLVVLNSLPKIALGPIIIIWFGAGIKSIVVMCFLILIVITILSMLSAFLECDSDKILLMKSFGATKLQILTKLILPNAFPKFISVLKIDVGMCWVGSIMGEYLVCKAGIGYFIVYGGQVFKLDLVMASTVILCVLAALMYCGVSCLEKRVYSKRNLGGK